MKSKKTTSKFGKNSLLILVAALFVSIQGAFAETETYSYDLADEEGLYIWDLTGSYSESLLGTITGDLNFDLTQDDKGKFTGGGYASFDAEGFHFEMDFTATGTIVQKKNIAAIKMTLKFKGTADDGDDIYNFTANETLKGEVDIDSGTFTCTVKGKVTVKGYGSESFDTALDLTIPLGMDGSSTLDIDVDSDPEKVTKWGGDGLVTLSNDETVSFSIKGAYNPGKDLYTFTLTSTDAKGSKLTITINAGDITKLSGKILGQNLKL